MKAACLRRMALGVALVSLIAHAPAEPAEPPVSTKTVRDDFRSLPQQPAIPPQADKVVYSNDFERTAGREWSLPITDTTPKGNRRFLGQFANDAVTLTLTNLPAHQSVTVSFDLYIIRTWDGHSTRWGPDVWGLSVTDGPALVRTTFSSRGHMQAYPDVHLSGSHPARTAAREADTLGYMWRDAPRDSVYSPSVTFSHTADSLQLNFFASGLSAIANESWGLDNVRITVSEEPVAPSDEGDHALTFDGRDDCVVIPNSPSLDLKGSLTLEARVTSDADNDGQIIWRGDVTPAHDPYELHLEHGRMEFRIDGYFQDQHRSFVVQSREPVDSAAHLWTGVYDKDAGMLYLYSDGVLEAAEEIFGDITYDTSAMWNMIGAVDRGTWQHFKGTIGEVRIWNVARSPEEIKRDVTRRLTGQENGLAACWRFAPKAGQILRDVSPNHNHGVLGASPFPDSSDPAWVSSPLPQAHAQGHPIPPEKTQNLLTNGSFENGSHPGLGHSRRDPGSTDIVGWTVVKGSVDHVGPDWQASDGLRCIDLEGNAAFGGVAQTFPTQPGQVYLVTYDIAGNTDGPPTIKKMRIEAAAQSTESWFDTTGRTRRNLGWQTRTWRFTATDTKTTIIFSSAGNEHGHFGPMLDNVLVTPAGWLRSEDSPGRLTLPTS